MTQTNLKGLELLLLLLPQKNELLILNGILLNLILLESNYSFSYFSLDPLLSVFLSFFSYRHTNTHTQSFMHMHKHNTVKWISVLQDSHIEYNLSHVCVCRRKRKSKDEVKEQYALSEVIVYKASKYEEIKQLKNIKQRQIFHISFYEPSFFKS